MLEFRCLCLRSFVGVLVATATLLLPACTDSTPAPTASPAMISTITLDPSLASVSVGGTQAIAATLRDASGSVLSNQSVTWQSSNAGIATVSSAGIATGVSVGGPVTITATSEGKSGTAQLTVIVPVNTVELSDAAVSISIGATYKLAATLRDAANNVLAGRIVVWSTSNAGVATVSSAGVVTGVSAGEVEITATSAEGKSGAADVTVIPLQPVPVELRGTWRANLIGDASSTSLVIGEFSYSVSRPGEGTTTASLAANGPSTVRASGNPACPGAGSYQWEITGNTLTFRVVGGDDCSRRTDILTGQPWTRGS